MGAAALIVLRSFSSVARASFGTPARYSSTFLAGALFASVFLMLLLLFCLFLGFLGLARRLLIKADDVSRRIAKSRGDLRRVHPDRLHDLAAVSNDRLDGRGNAVNHDVDQQARLCR